MTQVQLGKWFTRNNRLVMIDRSVEVEDSPSPGMPPQRREVFEGIMFAADGKTEASRCTWEADGKYKTPSNVASQFDLVQLIEAAPAPTPEVAPEPPAEFTEADRALLAKELEELREMGQEDAEEHAELIDLLDPHRSAEEEQSGAPLNVTLNRLLDELKQFRQAAAAQAEPGDPAAANAPLPPSDVIILPVLDQSGSGSTETVETQTADGAAAELAGEK